MHCTRIVHWKSGIRAVQRDISRANWAAGVDEYFYYPVVLRVCMIKLGSPKLNSCGTMFPSASFSVDGEIQFTMATSPPNAINPSPVTKRTAITARNRVVLMRFFIVQVLNSIMRSSKQVSNVSGSREKPTTKRSTGPPKSR